jgi:hypothetical protein
MGIVVADLASSRRALGGGLGLTWAEPQRWFLDGWTPSGPLQVAVDVTWSHQGPAHLELIQGPPGSLWQVAESTQSTEIHHVAYWSADLVADVARKEEAGFELEITGAGGGGDPTAFAY